VRGASALEEVLAERRDAKLRAIVVWEPVIWSDVAPPLSAVLARLHDARVTQFWDPGRLLSRAMVGKWKRMGKMAGLDDDTIVWDWVGLYDTGERWQDGPPAPRYHGYPVVHAVADLRRNLPR
jgi:hypothetical protein